MTDTSTVSSRRAAATASGSTRPVRSTPTTVISQPSRSQEVDRLKHCGVLDRRHHEVSAAVPVGPRHALEGEIVGLRPAAGEDDLAGGASEKVGDLLPRRRHGRRCFASGCVTARRVAGVTMQVRLDGRGHLGVDGGGGVVVEVDHRRLQGQSRARRARRLPRPAPRRRARPWAAAGPPPPQAYGSATSR